MKTFDHTLTSISGFLPASFSDRAILSSIKCLNFRRNFSGMEGIQYKLNYTIPMLMRSG